MKRSVGAEQYYTDPLLAKQCLEFLGECVDLDTFDLFVEPSAGDGSFYSLLPESRRIGIDIHPSRPDIVERDFLTWLPPRGSRIATVGNPPFGQRAALAFSFIKHASLFSDVVAFVLPRSFNKYTFQNRIDPYFHLLGGFNCDAFYGPNGETHSIRTVFQVWRRQAERRLKVELPDSHPDFELRHCHLSRVRPGDLSELRDSFEFAIAQVGANFWPRDATAITRGSYWFVRPRVAGVRERFERLDFSFLDGMNTAHKSLSKRDIIAAYVAVRGETGSISSSMSEESGPVLDLSLFDQAST